MGEVELVNGLENEQLKKFGGRLEQPGFESLDNKKTHTFEKIKIVIVSPFHQGGGQPVLKMSTLLEGRLQIDYR